MHVWNKYSGSISNADIFKLKCMGHFSSSFIFLLFVCLFVVRSFFLTFPAFGRNRVEKDCLKSSRPSNEQFDGKKKEK